MDANFWNFRTISGQFQNSFYEILRNLTINYDKFHFCGNFERFFILIFLTLQYMGGL